ncbi:membrane-spanning 4-domains subfamily A member 4A-like isoform X3 [Hoplias malabaricus]|uniref:membrane-spanning 4-domains subfamily A member 4A-like isoform X3 n=1 Tax=Hoplias malabaricus TaxID=27720 RepID=UPI003462FB71
MSNPAVPLTNTGPGYTIVTHVISPESATAQTGQNPPSNNPLQRFLKGEPKALGTFQIMTGLITILMGIVLAADSNPLIIIFSGIAFWGSLLYITAGALAVSASNKLTKCQVVGSLVMNVFSAIAAGISIILLSLDLVIWGYRGCRYGSSYYEHYYNCSSELTDGILGVLLVFTIVQFIVSICLSAFACKSCCCSKPMVNVTVVSNPGGFNSVVNPFPQQPAPSNQQWMYTASGVSPSCPPMGNPPMGNPPMYSPQDISEVQSQLYN